MGGCGLCHTYSLALMKNKQNEDVCEIQIQAKGDLTFTDVCPWRNTVKGMYV